MNISGYESIWELIDRIYASVVRGLACLKCPAPHREKSQPDCWEALSRLQAGGESFKRNMLDAYYEEGATLVS
jgi:hypothetical protein